MDFYNGIILSFFFQRYDDKFKQATPFMRFVPFLFMEYKVALSMKYKAF